MRSLCLNESCEKVVCIGYCAYSDLTLVTLTGTSKPGNGPKEASPDSFHSKRRSSGGILEFATLRY